MKKTDKIFVAGSSGMVGSAIVRKLLSMGYSNILGSFNSRKPRDELFACNHCERSTAKEFAHIKIDLTQQLAVNNFFLNEKPEFVFLAAARVGGINANNKYPAEFIYENLTIQSNIIHSAYQSNVSKLLFLGSSCIYPKMAGQPIKEESLLEGKLEPTNEPYAIAKIAGIKMCESYNRQYGTRFIAVMPTNLYGPNDNFDLNSSHVLPALIRKFHEAKIGGKKQAFVWGTGAARREFLHVNDMADACTFIMNLDDSIVSDYFLDYPKPCFLNIGAGADCTIRELSELVADIVDFNGEIEFDNSKPDGTPQKLLDVSKLTELGWHPSIKLENGIKQFNHSMFINSV